MKKGLPIIIFILGIILPVSFASAGIVLSQYKYAWSSGVGYINFDNVIVTDNSVTGYAWSEKSGWINFSPAKGGVFNDGNGHLSGFAWGEGLGWIDFSGVVISTTTGKFSGTATGDVVGTINFNCPNYCDVRTDWTVAAIIPVTSTSTSGGSSSGSYSNYFSNGVSHVDSYNSPLVMGPTQSGLLKKDLSAGLATINVPINNLDRRTVFIIDELAVKDEDDYLIPPKDNLVNNAFYDIYAINEGGVLVHNFNHPIKIVLPISKKEGNLKNPGLYWLNETNWKWVLIPDAVFNTSSVTFYVDHLTKFAIFSSTSVSPAKVVSDASLVLPTDKKNQYINSEKTKLVTIINSTQQILDNAIAVQKTNRIKAIVGLIVLVSTIVLFKRKRCPCCW